MIKFLLITFIILFIVFKLVGFFFKLFIKGAVNNFQQQSNSQGPYNNQRHRQFSEGNINIDYVPDKKKERPDKDFKGGEYIDYEEVK